MQEAAADVERSSKSLTMYHRQQAVCVRKAYKQYENNNNLLVVFNDLNMTVPKGVIYGLLGASGCGKTTLLGCIIGRKRLNSGEIWVLGGKPGSRSSGVPGPRVGYMPQEVALYKEFTIRETSKYFGWINGMTTEKIEERLKFLSSLLLLPSADRFVKDLSGGQKRRVSLAIALLHEPELIILDEPTVGVDSLLRYNIWEHLTDITKEGNTTIIFTTHYINEAQQANLIALMRGGYFLMEESPENLMSRYGGASLENIFLKLSIRQNRTEPHRSNTLEESTDKSENEAAELDGDVDENFGTSDSNGSIPPKLTKNTLAELPPEEKSPTSFCDCLKVIKASHTRALMWKTGLWMWRNLPFSTTVILLPIIQFIFLYICLGHEPTDLPISVVNYELKEAETCKLLLGCNSTRLSCNYLTYLSKKDLQLDYYATEEEGKDAVRHGKAWATLVFSYNFSDAIRKRVRKGININNWDLVSSTINVYQDNSNGNIGIYTKRKVHFAFEDFFKEYLTSCEINSRIATIPVKYEEPIYGSDGADFNNFFSTGFISLMIFFLSLAQTAGTIILERNDGVLERTIVNGINSYELLFSHLITSWIVMLIHITSLLTLYFAAYGVPQNGSYGTVIALAISTGFCGMCYGFLISCVFHNETTASYVILGSFLPMQVLCGLLWPVEAMHDVLQIIAYVLPLTKSTESMRAVLSKGWGISSPEVYAGFISNVIWIIIFLSISLLFLRFKQS